MCFSTDKTSFKKKKRAFLWHSVARIVYRHHTDSFPYLLSPPLSVSQHRLSSPHTPPPVWLTASGRSLWPPVKDPAVREREREWEWEWEWEWERERERERRAVTEQSRTSCIHSNTEEMETNQTEERKRCGEDCCSRWITNIKTMRFAWLQLLTWSGEGPLQAAAPPPLLCALYLYCINDDICRGGEVVL